MTRKRGWGCFASGLYGGATEGKAFLKYFSMISLVELPTTTFPGSLVAGGNCPPSRTMESRILARVSRPVPSILTPRRLWPASNAIQAFLCDDRGLRVGCL